MSKTKKKNAKTTFELYAVFINGKFKESAYCRDDDSRSDDADSYIRACEKKYGEENFNYLFGKAARIKLPRGYKPRKYFPRTTNEAREMNYYMNKAKAEDDGVNYEA